ncbi:MAG TPA: response regulator transcription factor [Candidatus Polarisedimenticolaceae bacterium]|nr:response regulator transcription factor [Candidatus Polarisedimenticolaceae bacterium]
MGGTQPTVWVVDDDAGVRRSLKRLLGVAGYAVETFSSAEQLLCRPAPDGPACLVLDVRMPGMTGPQLFDRMEACGLAMPVVFLTGHGDVPTGIRAMKDGAVDFLLKPVDGAALLRAVEDAIARDGERLAQERDREAIRDRLRGLSPRERQVLADVVRGLPNKLTAADLGISEKTVKVHRHRIMTKTGASSLAELVRLVDAGGL